MCCVYGGGYVICGLCVCVIYVCIAHHAWKLFQLSHCDTVMNKRLEIGVTEWPNRRGQNLSVNLQTVNSNSTVVRVCCIFYIAEQAEEKENRSQTAQTKLLQQRSVTTPSSPAALSLCSSPPRSPRSEGFFDAHCCINTNMCSTWSECGCVEQQGQREVGQEKPGSLKGKLSATLQIQYKKVSLKRFV